MRMMLRVESDIERVTAVLHDLIEDTDYTLDDMRRLGYSEEVVEAVEHLTRREEEPYADYIGRIGNHAIARRVKLADLSDNMTNNRGVDSRTEERARLKRYREARASLLTMEGQSGTRS
jgi:(p)ppGpp synthase/HD superfamily hydrolase